MQDSRLVLWLSHVARHLIRCWARLYYPTIHVSGRHHVPSSGPVLFVANHPNSLLDPVMLGIATGRDILFLAKAPLFRIPFFGFILRVAGMIPAFRASDDKRDVVRNTDSLDLAAQALCRHHPVGVFPEGLSQDAPRVAQVKSGAARIVLRALQAGCTNLSIVPLAINYQKKERFRSAVWIQAGNPIQPHLILSEQASDPAQAARLITRRIDQALKSLAIHLNEPAWEHLLPELETFFPPPQDPQLPRPIALIRQRKRLADAMNYFLERDPTRARELAKAIAHYQRKLRNQKTTLDLVQLSDRPGKLLAHLVGHTLRIAGSLLPALAGLAHHLLPWLIMKSFLRPLQAPGRMVIALYSLLLGLPIFLLGYALNWWLLRLYFLPWVAWTWTALMPVAGLLAVSFIREFRQVSHFFFAQWKWLWKRPQLQRLSREKQKLGDQLQALAAEYAEIHPPLPHPRNAAPSRSLPSLTTSILLLLLISSSLLAWTSYQFRLDSTPRSLQPGLDLTAISAPTLRLQLDADAQLLLDLHRQLAGMEKNALRVQAQFHSGERSHYRSEDSATIEALFLNYINCRQALSRLFWKYCGAPALSDPHLRALAFTLHYSAAGFLQDSSAKLVLDIATTPQAQQRLNEANPALGLPSNLLWRIRRELAATHRQGSLLAAHRDYLDHLRHLEIHRRPPPFRQLHQVLLAHHQDRQTRAPALRALAKQDPLQQAALVSQQIAYDAQALLATWLGDTKIREPRRASGLITPTQLSRLKQLLKPGDILIERRNWYLSNAFLPGYWPHSALYLGSVEDLRAVGITPADLSPNVLSRLRSTDAAGHPLRLLESISEGVSFTSLQHSAGEADSVAVLRPKLPQAQLRECLLRALAHAGKPYDFQFDFLSADKLVCTELIYRAYEPCFEFPLIDVLGRKTMPALALVEMLTAESAPLQFVAFLDGDEDTGRSQWASEEDLISTLHRPALTWLQ